MPQIQRPTTLLLAGLGLAISADVLFYGRAFGLSVPLFVAGLLVMLAILARSEDRPATPANRWIEATALLFAGMVALRDSPTLVFFNMLATLGFLLLLVTVRRAEPLQRLEGWRLVGGAVIAGIECAVQPISLALQSTRSLPTLARPAQHLVVFGRGALLAAPILLVFTGLLALADGIFASYVEQALSFQLPFDFEASIGHIVFIAVIGWVLAGGLVVALREIPNGSLLRPYAETPAEGDTQRLRAPQLRLRWIGWGEALTVLILVDVLFAGFMLIQGAYLFGGLDTLERTGMTFAEYARRGFFELVAVACLALGLLLTAAIFARREAGSQQRHFNLASLTMVVLLLGMLASAAYRMWLYEEAYGFTELRLYTHCFMLWLALTLVLFSAALLRDRPLVFSHGVPAAAAALLLALNILNPDALIVRWNVERYYATGDLDTYYIGQLSADVVPEAAAALPSLDRETRSALAYSLTQIRERTAAAIEADGWPAWRLGRGLALSTRIEP
ncbi:MAG: DUF4173 domain-containing protein [Oscillochloris sp.]|nr:DUF4173 domain-containing protein [Oscillochloris sp.]